jgi:hypothetical protein
VARSRFPCWKPTRPAATYADVRNLPNRKNKAEEGCRPALRELALRRARATSVMLDMRLGRFRSMVRGVLMMPTGQVRMMCGRLMFS